MVVVEDSFCNKIDLTMGVSQAGDQTDELPLGQTGSRGGSQRFWHIMLSIPSNTLSYISSTIMTAGEW